MSERYEAVVIGSGFGGAITSCRLARKWPGKVLVLERGKRYPMGSFPRSPHALSRNIWHVLEEKRAHPTWIKRSPVQERGLFDLRSYRGMDVLMAAGLGGGSLIYLNVFLLPPPEVFDDPRWPESCKRDRLVPYYEVAKEVLGSRPLPMNGDPRRRVARTELFDSLGKELGRRAIPLDLNVFFGPDPDGPPIPIGEQAQNRYGARQTSCTYCAECAIGCNVHAKNTLDLNYLHVAEKVHHAEILTEHCADVIVPVDANANDDPTQTGEHGYRVYGRDLARGDDRAFLTERVIVSCGSLGSTELLLRCKHVHRSLPNLSPRLGKQFSGNGDFLSFVLRAKRAVDANHGPVITRALDFNLYEEFERDRAFLVEDASYPPLVGWFLEGVRPTFLRAPAVVRILKRLVGRFITGKSTGRTGYAASSVLRDDLSYNAAVLLAMGVDKSDGEMSLDGSTGRLSIDWPVANSDRLYRAILRAGRDIRAGLIGTSRLWRLAARLNLRPIFLPLLTWRWPFRRNVTVHPLGGCVLAVDAEAGVTSADPKNFGQVFGYEKLYVADGSIIPTAVGSNPTATISALSEMVAAGITGDQPDAELR